MRKLSILCLLLFCVSAYGQVSSQNARRQFSGTGVPTGACNSGPPWRSVYIRTTDNSEYQCVAGVWTKVTSGSPFTGGAFTTPLLGPDGTAAAPTFSFSSSGNSDNGMFLSSANALGFSTAGVERWSINSSGSLNPIVNNTYDIGNGSVNPRDVNVARSVISPLIIGGTGTTSTLTLQATSGVGAANSSVFFKVGNNGDVEALKISSTGLITASGTSAKYIDITSITTGSLNEGGLRLTRGDVADGYAQVSYKTGATLNWATGTREDTSNYIIFDGPAGLARLTINPTTGTVALSKGADVASAAAIVPTGNVFHVTGTTNITSIDATNVVAGATITIIFDGVLTFTDGGNLVLAGNFVTTAGDSITLVFEGTNFYEKSRSIN